MLRKSEVANGLIACLLVSSAETFGGEAPRQLPPVSRQAAQVVRASQSKGEYVEDEILVRFRDNASDRGIASAHAIVGTASMKRFRIVSKLELVRVLHGISVEEAIKSYLQHPDVLYAEPTTESTLLPSLTIPSSGSFGVFRTMANLAASLTRTSTLLKRGTSQPGVTVSS